MPSTFMDSEGRSPCGRPSAEKGKASLCQKKYPKSSNSTVLCVTPIDYSDSETSSALDSDSCPSSPVGVCFRAPHAPSSLDCGSGPCQCSRSNSSPVRGYLNPQGRSLSCAQPFTPGSFVPGTNAACLQKVVDENRDDLYFRLCDDYGADEIVAMRHEFQNIKKASKKAKKRVSALPSPPFSPLSDVEFSQTVHMPWLPPKAEHQLTDCLRTTANRSLDLRLRAPTLKRLWLAHEEQLRHDDVNHTDKRNKQSDVNQVKAKREFGFNQFEFHESKFENEETTLNREERSKNLRCKLENEANENEANENEANDIDEKSTETLCGPLSMDSQTVKRLFSAHRTRTNLRERCVLESFFERNCIANYDTIASLLALLGPEWNKSRILKWFDNRRTGVVAVRPRRTPLQKKKISTLERERAILEDAYAVTPSPSSVVLESLLEGLSGLRQGLWNRRRVVQWFTNRRKRKQVRE